MKIPGFIRNDFPRKLFALLFAVLVYCGISLKLPEKQMVDKVIHDVPVDILDESGRKVKLQSDMPEPMVSLHLRVPNAQLGSVRLTPEYYRGSVKAGGANRDGKITVRLDKDCFKVDPGITIKSITPKILTLHTDSRIAREVRVEAQLIDVDNDFLEGVTVTPKAVTLEGPESGVMTLAEIGLKTLPISAKGCDRSFYADRGFELPPGIKATPSTVRITVRIAKYRKKTLKLPVALLCSDTGCDISFVGAEPGAEVTFETSSSSTVDPRKVRLYVDATQLPPGEHKVGIQCHIPGQQTKSVSISPSELQIKIVKRNRE